MSLNKKIKPALVDVFFKNKIINTLRPPKKDYWEPTKNTLKNLFNTIILPNIWVIFFLIFLLVLLLYRYRNVQLKKYYQESPDVNAEPNLGDMTMIYYEQQKEASRQPKIIRAENKISQSESMRAPYGAYPMYPYTGGTPEPSGKK